MPSVLDQLEIRFQEINKGKEPIRSARLATLMTDMEKIFNIPVFKDEEFNRKNPYVINLYRKISKARDFEEVHQ